MRTPSESRMVVLVGVSLCHVPCHRARAPFRSVLRDANFSTEKIFLNFHFHYYQLHIKMAVCTCEAQSHLFQIPSFRVPNL